MQENKQEKSPIKGRILQYLEIKGITKYAFYKDSGVSRGILDQSTGISEENIARFLDYARDISLLWLITGEGDIFRAKSTEMFTLSKGENKDELKGEKRKVQKCSPFEDVEILQPNDFDGIVIPIYDISAAAGGGAYNSDHVEQLDTIKLPAKLLHRGSSYESIMVRGQSMTPTLQDGSYVICRVLNRSEWSGIRDGYVYVIVNREGETFIKRVKNRLKQHGFIVLTSDNPDKATYPNFQLEEQEIHRICFVEWYLSPKMPNIHDTYYNRLQEMSDDIDDLKSALQRVVKKMDEPSN